MLYSNCTSIITFKSDFVEKRITNYLDYNVFQREIYWLNLFKEKKIDFTPEIYKIDLDSNSITMSYCGYPITKQTIPRNWEIQIKHILLKLDELNCNHNDIKNDEILVKCGRIYLCDFGWASLGNDFSLGIGLNSLPKPYGICKNEKIYEIIDAL